MAAANQSQKVLKRKDWADALAGEARSVREDKVARGWKTTKELSRQFNRSYSYTRQLVAEMVLTGKAKVRRYRIACATRTVAVPHYFLLGK